MLKIFVKKIVLVGLLISSSSANEYFIDFLLGNSLNGISYGYTRFYQNGSGDGFSSEGGVYKPGVRAGYSYELDDSLFIEPSVGWNPIGNFGSFYADDYSIELPLLYRYKLIKFGPLLRYNYLSDIEIYKNRYDKALVDDKPSYSLGIKAMIVTQSVDFIFSYEYMLNADYTDVSHEKSQVTTTNIDLNGAYFAFGLRAKF